MYLISTRHLLCCPPKGIEKERAICLNKRIVIPRIQAKVQAGIRAVAEASKPRTLGSDQPGKRPEYRRLPELLPFL